MPAVNVPVGCCVTTSCVAPANVELALNTRFGTPVLLTVRLCAPAAAPSVQENVASPAVSVAAVETASDPLPVVTAIVSGMPPMASPSVAIERTVTVSVLPPGAVWFWPATAMSDPRRGRMLMTAVSAGGVSNCATMCAYPRDRSVTPLPTFGAVTVAMVG